jgi:hypothetical protein
MASIRRLRMEVVMHLGCDYQRGAHVDDIQDLDDMLLLAHRISRHGGGIFLHRLARLSLVLDGPSADVHGVREEQCAHADAGFSRSCGSNEAGVLSAPAKRDHALNSTE